MRRSRYLVLAVTLLVVCLAVVIGVRQLYTRVQPYLLGSGCAVSSSEGSLALDLEQAANAATIAAVGVGEGLPPRAVTIALATAFQESHLRNVSHGDRDSVGLFQQRPSQGWGAVEQILDPVYAASQFYDALVEVRGYLDMPLDEAAQRVQRSADGSAYAQHEERATLLAAALTGGQPAALHCWYPDDRPDRTDAALSELGRTFTSLSPDGDEIDVSNERDGWAVATWIVAHAHEYGIPGVRYDGHAWQADRGHDGWRDSETRSSVGIVHVL